VRVSVELGRVERVEQRLPRGAQGLAASAAGHQVAEPLEGLQALALLAAGAVERRLPDVRRVALLAEPPELDREVREELGVRLARECVGAIGAAGEDRLEVHRPSSGSGLSP
jgi:hypothetical protein